MNMTTVPSNQLKAMQHEIADLKEQVAQQAEAIRLKDAALEHVIGMNLSMVTTKLCTAAITIQPSPEILQARDERVAEAISTSMSTELDSEFFIEKICSGEWRKYL